jgi:hypothetical protein
VQRERLVEQHRRLSNAAESLIADIRSRPGMSRFLLPPAFSSLLQSLPEGLVVFLNVSELGHQALILNGSTKSVQNLPLTLPARIVGTNRKAVNHKSSHTRDNDDGLTAEDSVQSVAEQFRAGLRERATFGDSLADLWVYIVMPIIDLLQLKVCILPVIQVILSLKNLFAEVKRSEQTACLVVRHRHAYLPSNTCCRRLHKNS